MVACAFPDGVAEEAFWPLMIHLGESMSLRQLAAFMGHLFRREVSYHDSLVATSHSRPEPPNLDDVRRRLVACGYANWLESEDYGNDPD